MNKRVTRGLSFPYPLKITLHPCINHVSPFILRFSKTPQETRVSHRRPSTRQKQHICQDNYSCIRIPDEKRAPYPLPLILSRLLFRHILATRNAAATTEVSPIEYDACQYQNIKRLPSVKTTAYAR